MIIGMIRYAILVESSEFLHSTKKLLELYEEPYFSERLKIFRGITLKSFANQTCKDFKLLVYHTELIPADKKKIFDDLEKEYPFMKCIYISDSKMYIPEELKEKKQLTFRIDNDDGIVVNFIEKLQNIKNTTEDINFFISVPKIRKVKRIEEDKYRTICFDYELKTPSMGLSYYSDNGTTIMDFDDHTKIYGVYPLKILDGNGGLQIINGYNVGNNIGRAKHYQTKKEFEETLRSEKYPIVDLDSLPIIPEVSEKR